MHDLEHIIKANTAIASPAIDSAKATGSYLNVFRTGLNVTGTIQHPSYAAARDDAVEFVGKLPGSSVDLYGPDGTLTATFK